MPPRPYGGRARYSPPYRYRPLYDYVPPGYEYAAGAIRPIAGPLGRRLYPLKYRPVNYPAVVAPRMDAYRRRYGKSPAQVVINSLRGVVARARARRRADVPASYARTKRWKSVANDGMMTSFGNLRALGQTIAPLAKMFEYMIRTETGLMPEAYKQKTQEWVAAWRAVQVAFGLKSQPIFSVQALGKYFVAPYDDFVHRSNDAVCMAAEMVSPEDYNMKLCGYQLFKESYDTAYASIAESSTVASSTTLKIQDLEPGNVMRGALERQLAALRDLTASSAAWLAEWDEQVRNAMAAAMVAETPPVAMHDMLPLDGPRKVPAIRAGDVHGQGRPPSVN